MLGNTFHHASPFVSTPPVSPFYCIDLSDCYTDQQKLIEPRTEEKKKKSPEKHCQLCLNSDNGYWTLLHLFQRRYIIFSIPRMWRTEFYFELNKGKDEVLCIIMMYVISFTQQLLNIWCISCANCGTGGVAVGSLYLTKNLLSQSELAARFI